LAPGPIHIATIETSADPRVKPGHDGGEVVIQENRAVIAARSYLFARAYFNAASVISVV
jgi:hypothetical protein